MSNVRLAVTNLSFASLAITTQLFGTSIIFFVIARMSNIDMADFGRLTYAFTLSQLTVLFFEYGLGPYVAKQIAGHSGKDRSIERNAYGLHLGLMIIGFGLYLVLVRTLDLSNTLTEVCDWIGASVFLTSSMRFLYAYHQGKERHQSEFVSTLLEISIQISIIIYLFLAEATLTQVAHWYFFGRLLAWALAYVVLGVSDGWLQPGFDRNYWQVTLRRALPFNLTFVAAFAITSVDTLMLQYFAAEDAEKLVGLYQAALRLILIPTILATVVTRVFLPQLTRMGTESNRHLVSLNNLLIVVGVLAAIFFYFQAEALVLLAYGPAFVEVATLVAPLAITLSLRFGAAFNLYFTLSDQMWFRFGFALVALSCLVLLNYLLIPIYGVMGTVYASIVTHVVYWLPVFVAMAYNKQPIFLGLRWLYLTIVAALYIGLQLLLDEQSIWLVVLVSIPFTILALSYALTQPIRGTLFGELRQTFMRHTN